MKKLMIAVAIVCAAAITQAASISWGFTWAVDADGNDLPAGVSAYLVNVADYAIETATDDLINGAFNALKATDTKETKYSGDEGAYVNVSGLASSLTGSQSFYTVISTPDAFIVSDVITKTMNNAGGTDFTLGEISTYDEGTGLSTSNYTWQTVNVPEPTTGLLLLLGMAGLALKRKVA